jgi:hypothetical protein
MSSTMSVNKQSAVPPRFHLFKADSCFAYVIVYLFMRIGVQHNSVNRSCVLSYTVRRLVPLVAHAMLTLREYKCSSPFLGGLLFLNQ